LTFLIDTNVLSEPTRPKADARVCAWLDGLSKRDFAISVISWGEILRGVAALPEGKRKASLAQWIHSDLAVAVGDRILSIDRRVAEVWAHLLADATRRGLSARSLDALIAATALVHGLVVATRNTRDFAMHGVKTFDPWAAA
jgi:toxin FitB